MFRRAAGHAPLTARTDNRRAAAGHPVVDAAPRRLRVSLRSPSDIEGIETAGRIVAEAIEAASRLCVGGRTTRQLELAAVAVIKDRGGRSLFKNYPSACADRGFPGEICVSVNEEVVHGIPGSRMLEEGDIVTIDCGVELGGWCADSAATFAVGCVSPEVAHMVEAAQSILDRAIAAVTPGVKWSSIARRMQRTAQEAGLGVVRQYVGHGIGRELHELPQVPSFVSQAFLRDGDFTLESGMVLAIEPMLTLGSPRTQVLDDGWTVVTADGEPACHVEHTVAVTPQGARILTGCPLSVCPG